MVFIFPSFKGMTVMAQSLVIRNLVVIAVTIYVVYGQLAFMNRYELTLFAVILLVKLPRTLYVKLGYQVFVITPVVLFLAVSYFIGLLDPNPRAAYSTIPHQTGFVHIGEGVP